MPRPIVDLTGERFGRLVVRRLAPQQRKGRHARWIADCDCGGSRIADSNHLRRGETRSCGCLATERGHFLQQHYVRTHGGTGTPEYQAWRGMLARCGNPKLACYADYGGRGITVCEEWRTDFAAFLRDVGPRPSAKHSIDRIDNDGNYQPGNVRWATRRIQNTNRRPRGSGYKARAKREPVSA